jgi:hypothetical protein
MLVNSRASAKRLSTDFNDSVFWSQEFRVPDRSRRYGRDDTDQCVLPLAILHESFHTDSVHRSHTGNKSENSGMPEAAGERLRVDIHESAGSTFVSARSTYLPCALYHLVPQVIHRCTVGAWCCPNNQLEIDQIRQDMNSSSFTKPAFQPISINR